MLYNYGMSLEDDEEQAKKKRQRALDEQLAAKSSAQPDDYGRNPPKAAEPEMIVTSPKQEDPPPPVAAAPKEDEYERKPLPVEPAAFGTARPPEQSSTGGEALRQYFQACQDNDPTAATKLADEHHFTPGALRHGINMLVITHQNYEGAGGLLSKCGLAGASGVDPGFMNDLLDRTNDKSGAVKFLQGMGASFDDEHMMKIQSTNPEDAIKVIKSGQFDATQNGSRCLLHAAGDGQKSVFNALMEAGANPLTAVQKGSSDPRNEGMYETATKWAGEFYKAHPEITAPKQDAVSLEGVTARKIATLAPSVPRR